MSCIDFVCKSCGHMAGSERPVLCANPRCLSPTLGFSLEWDEQQDTVRFCSDEDDWEIEDPFEGKGDIDG